MIKTVTCRHFNNTIFSPFLGSSQSPRNRNLHRWQRFLCFSLLHFSSPYCTSKHRHLAVMAASDSTGDSGNASGGSEECIKNKNDQQYLFVVRHGDRWDYSNPEWKKLSTSRTGDSPLSTLGHKQAMETGKFLDSWLYENGFTTQDITWLSSPFLRCLETSNDALNSFQKLNVDTLPILPEYSVFEWDGHDGEWHKDLPTLEERKHYFPRLDISHESLFIPTLPEARDKFQQRCQDAIDKLDTRYPFKGGQVLVIVTHAAGCVMLSKVLTKGELHDITPAGPCSIYGFTRTKDAGNVWTLDPHDKPDGFNGYTAHLAEQGSTTVPWNNFGDGKIKFYTGPPTSRFAPSLEEQEEQRKHGQPRTT